MEVTPKGNCGGGERNEQLNPGNFDDGADTLLLCTFVCLLCVKYVCLCTYTSTCVCVCVCVCVCSSLYTSLVLSMKELAQLCDSIVCDLKKILLL